MAEQKILSADNDYKELDEYLKAGGHKRILLVCGSSIKHLKLIVSFVPPYFISLYVFRD